MLVLATSVLFFGILSIDDKLGKSRPYLGLKAVKGSSFVHVTWENQSAAEAYPDVPIRYMNEEALIQRRLQVLSEVIGSLQREDGSELVITWSLQSFEPVLLFREIHPQSEIQQWEEELAGFEQLFPRIVEVLGAGAQVQVFYLPDQQSSDSLLKANTIPIEEQIIPAEPAYFVRLTAGFTFLAIGFIIYFSVASRRLPYAELFLLVSIGFFVLFTFESSQPNTTFTWISYWLEKLAYLFVPVILLHYLVRFSQAPERRMRRRYLYPLYLPSLVLLAANIIIVAGATAPATGEPALLARNSAYQLVATLQSLLMPLFIFAALYQLFRSFNSTDDLDRKRMIKWLFWGIGIGLLPFSLVSYPGAAVGLDNEVIDLAVSLPLFITPFSFALAVFSLRFLDIEVIFRRGFVYLATSFGMLGVYLLLMFGLTSIGGAINTQSLVIISGGVILLATLISARMKDQVQQLFDRLLYRDFYEFRRTLQEFSVELSYERDLDRLLQKISDRIRETFTIREVLVFIDSPSRTNFILSHSTINDYHVQYIGAEDSDALRAKLLSGKPLYIDQVIEIAAAHELRETRIVTLIPFLSLGEVIGFLAIGNTVDRDILTSDDVDLLTSLADRAAVSIDNAMLYRDLQNRAEELRQLKEFSENIVESVDSGICTVDTKGIVRSWNTALEELFNIKREAAIGKRFLALLPKKLANVIEPYINPDEGTERFHNLYKVNVKGVDDSVHTLNISFAPLGAEMPGESHADDGMVVIVDDITDGVKMEEQLQQQEKMASLGLLSAGVAHEVNTPLAGIAGYIQMLQRKEVSEEISTILDKVEKQAFRASRIINSLLNFSRQSASEQGAININTLITDSLTLLENQLRYPDVRVATDFEGELYTIVGDRSKLQQVVINLLLNARDSMNNGGDIRIKTRNRADQVLLQISDTGVGIEPEVLPKIFDPFFTTKKIGQGTGLGLSVSYGIIQEHNGDIQVDSKPGQGTTFTLLFPASRRKVKEK